MGEYPVQEKTNCPSCGSPLNLAGGNKSMVVCSFCGMNVALHADSASKPVLSAPIEYRKNQILNLLLERLAAGKKIEAIKIYRQNFQVELVEAKKAVEYLEAHGTMELPDPVEFEEHEKFEPIKPPQYPATPVGIPHVPQQPKRSGGCCLSTGVVIGIIVVGIVLAVFVFSMLSNSKHASFVPGFISPILETLKGKPTLLDPVVWIPADGGTPDIALQARRFDTDPYTTAIARIAPSSNKILWETDPFVGKDVTVSGLYSDGAWIFVVIKSDLHVFNAVDGKLAWKAKLSDKSGYCSNTEICMFAQDQVFLILTADQNLQAFKVTDGTLLWQHINDYGSNGMYIYKDWVVIYAKGQETSGNYLAFLNLKTGVEEKKVSPKEFYGGPKLYFDDTSLYILDRQIEKWDLSVKLPKIIWTYPNDLSFDDEKIVIGEDYLYAKANHSIYSIDKNSGNFKALIHNENFEFTPMEEKQKQVLLLSKRTRGTSVTGLWTVDMATGEQVGPIDLGEGKYLQDSSESVFSADQYVWTEQFAGDTLTVVKFSTEPNEVIIEPYNLASGEKLKTTHIPLTNISSSIYTVRAILGWQKNILWVMIDSHVMAIDVDKHTVVFSN
jgi:hypothetical protein